jgi:cytochrome c553
MDRFLIKMWFSLNRLIYSVIIEMEREPMRARFIKPAILVSIYLGFCQGTNALAQNTDATKLYHRGLAATCANCHGTDGKGVPDGGMPLINNLTSEQMLTQLKAFKSGAREGTIMPQLAKGYSDEQLETIAKQLGKPQ